MASDLPSDDDAFKQYVNVTATPPCTLDVQVSCEHELEFRFDATGHVTEVSCSCGKNGRVEML